MKKLSIINEILFAALVAFGCYGVTWILGPGVWAPQLMRLLIAIAASAQCLHNRASAQRRGNLPLLVAALIAVIAPGFLFYWTVYFIWAAAVVWFYRSLIRYRSFVPAAADGMVTVCSLGAALFVTGLTGGSVVAIWTYLLGQALIPVVPASEGSYREKGSSDRFVSAHGDAERALRALAVGK